MKQIKIEKNITELKPEYESRQSYHGKATVTELNYNSNNKKSRIFILKSYQTIVACITDDSNSSRRAYINNRVDDELLFSHTTLRHIKEFFKQFYIDVFDYKKNDLKKYKANLQYIEIIEDLESISLNPATSENIKNATTPEQTRFFKNTFENYKESKGWMSHDYYLLISYKYNFSNHYFINIENIA